MYGDGITLVYDAYSIAKTGHDQKGNFLPLLFELGGGRPGGYVYASVPFAALFGPTPLAASFVSVLSGIGIVLLLYLLGKMFFSKGVGLAIAAIAAFNPWDLSLSRGPFETHFALFLALMGFYFFMKGLKKQYWFIFFGLSFGLAIQTYSTYGLVIPLITVWLLVWHRRFNFFHYLKKPLFLISLTIIVASTSLSLFLMVSRGNQDRFGAINIFKSSELRYAISQKIQSDRLFDQLSPSISHSLHNPQIEFMGILAENYFSNFFPDFLFLHGDENPRHNPAEMGEFFWIEAVLLIIGIVYLFKFKKQILILLSGWILIAPIPTSLVGGAHALRSSFLLPPILILIGIGLWRIWSERIRVNILVLSVLMIVFFVQFIYFFDRFYFIAPKKHARFWSYPAKVASLLAAQNRQKFDFVILSNDIDNMEFAYPVYTKLEPTLIIKQNHSPAKIDEYSFFKYDNVYIGSLPHTRAMQFIKDLPGPVLYIGSDKEQSYLENYQLIRGFDGQLDLVVVAKSGTADLNLTTKQ